MAKEKNGSPGKAERFELYIRGLEIANGYTELLDPTAQRKRFLEDNETAAQVRQDDLCRR